MIPHVIKKQQDDRMYSDIYKLYVSEKQIKEAGVTAAKLADKLDEKDHITVYKVEVNDLWEGCEENSRYEKVVIIEIPFTDDNSGHYAQYILNSFREIMHKAYRNMNIE